MKTFYINWKYKINSVLQNIDERDYYGKSSRSQQDLKFIKNLLTLSLAPKKSRVS